MTKLPRGGRRHLSCSPWTLPKPQQFKLRQEQNIEKEIIGKTTRLIEACCCLQSLLSQPSRTRCQNVPIPQLLHVVQSDFREGPGEQAPRENKHQGQERDNNVARQCRPRHDIRHTNSFGYQQLGSGEDASFCPQRRIHTPTRGRWKSHNKYGMDE